HPGDGVLAAVLVHAFHVHIHLHLEAAVAHLDHAAHQFDDGAGRNRVLEVDAFGGHRDQRLAAEARGGDEGHLVQPGQRRAAEQGAVVVGGRREHRLADAGRRQLDTALDFLFATTHVLGSFRSDHNEKSSPRAAFFRQEADLGQLFLDARRLAGQLAQVVQLGLAHVTATLDGDAVDQRGVGLEGTLDAHTAGDLAHGEGAVQAAVALADHHAFVGLQTGTVAFLHTYLNDHGVAGGEGRDLFAHLFSFDLLNDLVGHAVLLRQAVGACHRYVIYRSAGECT